MKCLAYRSAASFEFPRLLIAAFHASTGADTIRHFALPLWRVPTAKVQYCLLSLRPMGYICCD